MKYKVIVAFRDGKDEYYDYSIGDKYPRKGYTPTTQRANELESDKNTIGKPLIKSTGKAQTKTKRLENKNKGEG